MAAAIERPYLDPSGNYVMGYVIDNKTYKDAEGKNRIDVGSQVLGDDGTLYQMTENGGVIVTKGGAQAEQAAARDSGAIIRPYLDENGNYVMGYVLNDRTYKDPSGQNRVEIGSQVLGNDGTLYRMTENGGVAVTNPSGTVPVVPGGNPDYPDSEKYINDMYAERERAIMAALESAYQQNVSDLDDAAAKIPEQYQAARNQTAAQSEIQKANFNEYAAASGLNSGAGGQAQLAMGNQLQGYLSGISRAEADALSGLELQRTKLSIQYQNEIKQAIAEGNFHKAQMLYDNYWKTDAKLTQQKQFDATMLANQNQFDATMSYNTGNSDFEKAMAIYQITKDPSVLSKWLTPEQTAALTKGGKAPPEPSPELTGGNYPKAKEQALHLISLLHYSGSGGIETADQIADYLGQLADEGFITPDQSELIYRELGYSA